jgi:hypothetical protein
MPMQSCPYGVEPRFVPIRRGAPPCAPEPSGDGGAARPDGGIGPYTKVRMSVGADALIGPSPVSRRVIPNQCAHWCGNPFSRPCETGRILVYL